MTDVTTTKTSATTEVYSHGVSIGQDELTEADAAHTVADANSTEALLASIKREKEALTSKVDSLEQRLDRLQKVQKERSTYDDWGHKRTYRLLQLAYDDCLYIMSEQGRHEFAQAATKRQVPVGQGGNSFLPMVKVMWGEFDYSVPSVKFEGSDNLVKWRHNRSAEKYANVFRYLHDNEVAVEAVALFIENFRSKEYGDKLNGIVAADQAANAVSPKVKASPDEGRAALSDRSLTNAIATIPRPSSINQTEGLVIIVARAVGDELDLLGEVNIEQKVLDDELPKIAKRCGYVSVNVPAKMEEKLRKQFAKVPLLLSTGP
ncbi:hypothetical protein N825_17890 [Skermanella stibiiresistens SB22]|uniref:Uncharacterized protein n=1 Tax=Skermanella stibiiresistens SB22 TaxID=1385369 RepID=W9H154_9PROT|nr:hypothetical protein [Skermanella stibiiresistens]EWY37483.1 hypothetical protein N825_17890 [Skermanella stibiiresistens SB22]